MAVLTLQGKPINWADPPAMTAKVKWSRTTRTGRPVYGSLRSIAWLDHIDALCMKRFGVHIVIIQSAFNTGVPASEGTHDEDACYDLYIPGVGWLTQQAFFRANGAGAYARVAGWSTPHIHLFVLPPVFAAGSVSERFRKAGLVVGKYVDGGWSLYGRVVGSSQIADYYMHRDATANHAHDPSWFPEDIDATVFDMHAYARRQKAKTGPKRVWMTLVNIPKKLAIGAITQCIEAAMKRGSIVLVNESFSQRQRDIYAAAAKRHGFSYYGLRTTPNPIFYKTAIWRRKSGRVIKLHDKYDQPNDRPGYYAARYMTEVVLVHRKSGKVKVILNTHLAAEPKFLNLRWVRRVKNESIKIIRDVVRTHVKAGREVELGGDMNRRRNWRMPRGFRWFTPAAIIDKWGGSGKKGEVSTFPIPSDHKRGQRLSINL